jgi:hypothetical protein
LRNAVLAVATVMVVLQFMLMVPGGGKLPNWLRASGSAATTPPSLPSSPPADVARCQPGQDSGCVGGRATLILVPATPAAVGAKPLGGPALPATAASTPGPIKGP